MADDFVRDKWKFRKNRFFIMFISIYQSAIYALGEGEKGFAMVRKQCFDVVGVGFWEHKNRLFAGRKGCFEREVKGK